MSKPPAKPVVLIPKFGKVLVKNNLAVDLKIKCLEEGTTQAELADKTGTSASYVSRLINHPEKLVNKVFIELYDSLGYDIELHYVKKGE